MTLLELINKTKTFIRDKDGNIFERLDIVDFINEGIDRMSTISELSNIPYLYDDDDEVKLMPLRYHHLLAVYASARCFEIDERFFQGTQKMNEFESKLEELEIAIKGGEVSIVDESGDVIQSDIPIDYVVDTYHEKNYVDLDDGVEGVE